MEPQARLPTLERKLTGGTRKKVTGSLAKKMPKGTQMTFWKKLMDAHPFRQHFERITGAREGT
jgi:hypothetical protein